MNPQIKSIFQKAADDNLHQLEECFQGHARKSTTNCS